ncbi:hypothetical protein V5P93_002431 [Actinokineospora auranticolor]|uniref:Uncharacterized protein n=1 Tax=Actinokineospora auranticolor TaxID=155976 RepID=A0A2S6GMS8_9PSEU|nr:hypothetical protein [Actinokineospora auranticolor]PPK66538.1 hypothetical protein CLV40_110242 [Actinokineospora auranticolor]
MARIPITWRSWTWIAARFLLILLVLPALIAAITAFIAYADHTWLHGPAGVFIDVLLWTGLVGVCVLGTLGSIHFFQRPHNHDHEIGRGTGAMVFTWLFFFVGGVFLITPIYVIPARGELVSCTEALSTPLPLTAECETIHRSSTARTDRVYIDTVGTIRALPVDDVGTKRGQAGYFVIVGYAGMVLTALIRTGQAIYVRGHCDNACLAQRDPGRLTRWLRATFRPET